MIMAFSIYSPCNLRLFHKLNAVYRKEKNYVGRVYLDGSRGGTSLLKPYKRDGEHASHYRSLSAQQDLGNRSLWEGQT